MKLLDRARCKIDRKDGSLFIFQVKAQEHFISINAKLFKYAFSRQVSLSFIRYSLGEVKLEQLEIIRAGFYFFGVHEKEIDQGIPGDIIFISGILDDGDIGFPNLCK